MAPRANAVTIETIETEACCLGAAEAEAYAAATTIAAKAANTDTSETFASFVAFRVAIGTNAPLGGTFIAQADTVAAVGPDAALGNTPRTNAEAANTVRP